MAKRAKTVTRSVAGMLHYAGTTLRLKGFLAGAGEGRSAPEIKAPILINGLLTGLLLRAGAYSRIEDLSKERGANFSDSTLGYFTERYKTKVVREALVCSAHRAKRNKAFAGAPLVGLAVDGTEMGQYSTQRCPFCRPHDEDRPQRGYRHGVCALSVVGVGITLPLDVEPYGPGDSEYAAGQRLLQRAIPALGVRFAQYIVADAKFATAPFLHAAGDQGMHVLARLKDNLPGLHDAARQRFLNTAPHLVLEEDGRPIELWDAQDFEPWDSLRWPWVRVLRYRYEDKDGEAVDAYWLTDMPQAFATTQVLFQCAKSRWEIENQGFNDAKNRYGFGRIRHHQANSVVIHWLLVFLAMAIERLYRMRHLRRGTHRPLSAQQLVDLLWQNLHITAFDTS